MIDCNLEEENADDIIEEIKRESKSKGIHRFISTHPDEDHIHGLEFLVSRCVCSTGIGLYKCGTEVAL